MALLPQDQRGQILLMLTVAAAVVGWVFWQGNPIPPKVMGWAEAGDSTYEADSVAMALEDSVRKVKRDISLGASAELDARLARYRASLDLIRQLVPTTTQVADLLDGISTRARVRGASIVEFNMQDPESSFPFDKKRGRLRITGTFDQVAETLADIAALPQVVAPYDIELQRVQISGNMDSTRFRGVLDAKFMIMTYVRSAQGAAAAGAAAAGAPAAGAPAGAAPRPAGTPGATRE